MNQGSNPAAQSPPNAAHALLQQLNKRMAAQPPQLQQHGNAMPTLDGQQQVDMSLVSQMETQFNAGSINGTYTQDQGGGPLNGHHNPLLTQMLKDPPLELNGYDNGKIFSEVPDIEQWQEYAKIQRQLVQNMHQGGGGGNGMVLGSGVTSSEMGQCTDLGGYQDMSMASHHQYSGVSIFFVFNSVEYTDV